MNFVPKCEICELDAQSHDIDSDLNLYKVQCARCGSYIWDGGVLEWSSMDRMVRLSAFVREQNRLGITPRVTTNLINRVERNQIPRLMGRCMAIVVEMSKHITKVGEYIDFSKSYEYLAISYCHDFDALNFLLQILDDHGYVKPYSYMWYGITTRGLIAAEDHQHHSVPSASGFVAMSFDSDMMESYVNGFDPAIRLAGYNPIRIDQKDHANPISDEIMAEIRRARFLVADYTKSNNGVYFEAGFAAGLGIPVIPTCREDKMYKLHFDVKHINTLSWKDPQALSQALAKRISAILGDGPHRLSNL